MHLCINNKKINSPKKRCLLSSNSENFIFISVGLRTCQFLGIVLKDSCMHFYFIYVLIRIIKNVYSFLVAFLMTPLFDARLQMGYLLKIIHHRCNFSSSKNFKIHPQLPSKILIINIDICICLQRSNSCTIHG